MAKHKHVAHLAEIPVDKVSAPEGSAFLWLSAPKPIVPPGTAFPAGFTDLQSWMRDDPPLAPDWLRIGTDIIKGNPIPTFNAVFSLQGVVDKHAPAPQEGSVVAQFQSSSSSDDLGAAAKAQTVASAVLA